MEKIGAVADGVAEDIIRAITQLGCTEVHYKTLLEKFTAELENGIVDIDDQTSVDEQIEKIQEVTEEINEIAELRRASMMALFNLFPADEEEKKKRLAWHCSVKHLSIAAYTLFESYQASGDTEILTLSLNANKRLVKALTRYLGVEPTDCAACFSDALKSAKQ